jgi:predicted nucleotidyltransferase
MNPSTPTKQQIERVVELVVGAMHPTRIVLFGSAARDNGVEARDLDILVVVPEGTDCSKATDDLYRLMYKHRVGVAVDFVVATESTVALHSNTPGMVFSEIAREGRELYAA